MIKQIRKKKTIIILIIFSTIFLISCSIATYFLSNFEVKGEFKKSQQNTIYISKYGIKITTDLKNLSNMEGENILQIGFYKNDQGEIQVVQMPKTIEKIPNQLPPEITSLQNMFYDTQKFNQDISKWDISNITNMNAMFKNASSFNQNLSKWNTSKVTDMNSMFANASSFNQDLSNWDVSNVKSMNYMFDNASSFNQDLSNWHLDNLKTHIDFSNNSGITDSSKLPKFKKVIFKY